jgi:hypothetical protein
MKPARNSRNRHTSSQAENDLLWAREADRRYRAYRLGRTNAIPANQAIAEARHALRTIAIPARRGKPMNTDKN